jgi:hypothetical protein
MKASAVYRKAAEIIDAGKAITMAYACLRFEPEAARHTASLAHFAEWLGERYPDSNSGAAKEHRVLALLLMAEISRDEE